jgi:pimeloyl-ACP methyl ester carboxylesterase
VWKPAQDREPGIVRFVARELAAYALHGVLGLAPGRLAPPVAGAGPSVLFVHGHGGNPGAFALLRRALGRRGYGRFAVWAYDSRGTVDAAAARLARWARASQGGELLVVAHSLGGVICRAWLQDHGGRAQARALVTMSTPHRGIADVPGARLLPLVRELRRGSPLLARLAASAGVLDGLPCLSIVSTRDHFVCPWSSADFGAARLVPIHAAGHVGLLFSSEVHGIVAEHLDFATRP